MLANATVVDLGDAVSNGVAAFAAVVAVIAVFTADSRAKDANKNALDANATAREARDIARKSLGVSERTDLREMNLAIYQPVNEIGQKLIDFTRLDSESTFEEAIEELSDIEALLNKIYGIIWPGSLLSEYVAACVETVFAMRSTYWTLKDLNEKVIYGEDLAASTAMGHVHGRIQTCAHFMRFNLSLSITSPPDDPKWVGRTNSIAKFRGRLRYSLTELYVVVEKVSREEAEDALFY